MRLIFGSVVEKWRRPTELAPQMNYSYYYMWKKALTGDTDFFKFKIDLNSCPIFFAYGSEAMTFLPDRDNLIRIQFFKDEWLDEMKKNEKDGNGCKVVAFDSNHWFFKHGHGPEYTTHLKKWLEMH